MKSIVVLSVIARRIPKGFNVAISALSAATMLVILMNCSGPSSADTYTFEYIEDVKHIRNHAPLWGDEPKIGLEFVRKVGDPEDDDERYLFHKPCDIEVDSEGNIYVLDGGNYRVVKYDRDWNFITSFGRQGEGPGEFRDYQLVSEISGEKLFVIDDRYSTTAVFDLEGRFLYDLKLDKFFPEFTPLNTGEFIVSGVSGSLRENTAKDVLNEGDVSLVYIQDEDGNKLREFGKARIYKERDFIWYGNPFSSVIDNNGCIYIAFDYQNRIEKYSPEGQLLLSITRDLPFQESTRRDFDKPGLMMNVFSAGVYLDHKSRIWVIRYKNLEPVPNGTIMDVYSPEGILLTHVMTEKDILPNEKKLIAGDRFFYVDVYTDMCVYEYRIVEK